MEPPYAERHVRWCERTHEEIILMLLLDFENIVLREVVLLKSVFLGVLLYSF